VALFTTTDKYDVTEEHLYFNTPHQEAD